MASLKHWGRLSVLFWLGCTQDLEGRVGLDGILLCYLCLAVCVYLSDSASRNVSETGVKTGKQELILETASQDKNERQSRKFWKFSLTSRLTP